MLWEDFLLDNPDVQKEIEKRDERFHDPEFDEAFEELDEDDRGLEDDDDEFSEAVGNFEEFLKDNKDLDMPDKLSERFEDGSLRKMENNDDWEEVE